MPKFQKLGALVLLIAFVGLTKSAAADNAQQSYKLSNGNGVLTLDIFMECEVCPEMIVLPLGDFMMGSPLGESRNPLNGGLNPQGEYELGADERPVHRVEIDLPIAMGRNEVTLNQWMVCVDDGGCNGYIPDTEILRAFTRHEDNRYNISGDHPVINISYFDALSYVEWLNRKIDAEMYRLPTEAEWEYAARAGTQTRFAQGDELSISEANFYLSVEDLAKSDEQSFYVDGITVPVMELDAANAWGLRHMSGNVVERTTSCWTERYAGWSNSSTWLQQSRVDSCQRVSRGGAYWGGPDFARVASRGSAPETYRSNSGGFRVVRDLN